MRRCCLYTVILIIMILDKAEAFELRSFPDLRVLVHLQGIGDVWGSQGQWVGTKGQSRRLEGFQIDFVQPVPELTMEYMCHLEGIGDVPWSKAGNFCGTRGQSRRLEGFAVRLLGSNGKFYDVKYQCHLQGFGDFPLVENGQFCGTRGQKRRLEALRVWVERK